MPTRNGNALLASIETDWPISNLYTIVVFVIIFYAECMLLIIIYYIINLS